MYKHPIFMSQYDPTFDTNINEDHTDLHVLLQ